MRVTALALVLVLLMPMVAFATGGRLHDNAGLLTADEAVALSARLDSTSDSTAIYVGVVTVQSIGDVAAADYIDQYYHDNGMGAGETRDGIVAFVAMESRDIYLYTYGDRTTALFDDARIAGMVDAITPHLSGEDYVSAFNQFTYEVGAICEAGIKADQYGYDTDTGTRYDGYREAGPLIDPRWALASLGIALGVAALACAGVVGKYKLIFVSDSYPFRDKGHLELTRQEDTFLRKHVTSRVIQQNSGGGGSRSSTSGSVGGGSHGGGGGKF